MCGMLDMVGAAATRLLGAQLHLHKAVCKLGFVATAILGGVIADGFCIPPEQSDEVEGGPGNGQETGGTVRLALAGTLSDSWPHCKHQHGHAAPQM